MLAVILSALHVLTLALGLGAIVARGRALRAVAGGDAAALSRLFTADNLWGLAAVSWIVTGVLRAFGGIEKSPGFYLHNGFFWIKMALFAAVFVLEIAPMVTFIKWRIGLRKGAPPDTSAARRFIAINDAETALVLLIPFAAAAMARGLWLTT
jgi:putative membrane protein